MLTIYHNPRCSKSRATLELLEREGAAPRIVRYLEEPPSKRELRSILKALGLSPHALLRKCEALYKELGLMNASEEEALEAMVEHPILIERPIVVNGDRAAIGRPPENVIQVL